MLAGGGITEGSIYLIWSVNRQQQSDIEAGESVRVYRETDLARVLAGKAHTRTHTSFACLGRVKVSKERKIEGNHIKS